MGRLLSSTGGKRLGTMEAKPNLNDLVQVSELVQAGKLTPVIDKRYPLSDVPEAMRYLEGGQARGKVVVTV